MASLDEVHKTLDGSDVFESFETLHNFITSLSKKIAFRVFPIYVSYSIEDKVIALIYYKNRNKHSGALDVGLNLKELPKDKGFIDAAYMKQRGITFSTRVFTVLDAKSIEPEIRDILG